MASKKNEKKKRGTACGNGEINDLLPLAAPSLQHPGSIPFLRRFSQLVLGSQQIQCLF